MCMIWEREFANTTLQNIAAQGIGLSVLSNHFERSATTQFGNSDQCFDTSVTLAHFLRMRRKGFATSKVVTTLLSMALEDDLLEILLQNNAESIALDPWALKTYPSSKTVFWGLRTNPFEIPGSGTHHVHMVLSH